MDEEGISAIVARSGKNFTYLAGFAYTGTLARHLGVPGLAAGGAAGVGALTAKGSAPGQIKWPQERAPNGPGVLAGAGRLPGQRRPSPKPGDPGTKTAMRVITTSSPSLRSNE